MGKKLGAGTAKVVISEKRQHQILMACEKQPIKGVKKVNLEIKICDMEGLSQD